MKSKLLSISAVSAGFVAVFLLIGAYFEIADLFTSVISSVFVTLPLYYKSYKASFLAFLAGGVMGSIYGDGVADFVSGAFVGTGVFTALIGSLMSGIYGKKPLDNIKYHFKKKGFQNVLSEAIGRKVRNREVNNSVYDYLSTLEDGAEKSTTDSSPDKEI